MKAATGVSRTVIPAEESASSNGPSMPAQIPPGQSSPNVQTSGPPPPFYLSQQEVQLLSYLQQNQANLSVQQRALMQQFQHRHRLMVQHQHQQKLALLQRQQQQQNVATVSQLGQPPLAQPQVVSSSLPQSQESDTSRAIPNVAVTKSGDSQQSPGSAVNGYPDSIASKTTTTASSITSTSTTTAIAAVATSHPAGNVTGQPVTNTAVPSPQTYPGTPSPNVDMRAVISRDSSQVSN